MPRRKRWSVATCTGVAREAVEASPSCPASFCPQHQAVREYIRHPGAVVVVAILDNGELVFERQFRYPLDRVILELPAGKIDPGESILDTGKRELREETGYQAGEWTYLGVMHPCVGYSDERIEMFLARRLERLLVAPNYVNYHLEHHLVMTVPHYHLPRMHRMLRERGVLGEQRVVDALAALGSPNENGSITRTNDARAFLAKVDWHATADNLLTLRYNYTWSEQKNGTFDVDSWGRSANAMEKNSSHAVTGTLISTLAPSWYNEFRFQLAREDRPRPYDGPLINGTNRPFPDTAFDFERGYRFGMPFFIPVDYDDTRLQLNDNVSLVRGGHLVKAGVEYNRTNISQIFRGFANGRYIFGSTDGFLNFVDNPSYVECSDGSSSQSGTCPAGTDIVGPVLLYLQQAGVGGRTAEEAGTQSIKVHETAVFLQDTWQAHKRVRFDYGLRWEAQIQPDPITPPDEVFYAGFIGQTRDGQKFPSNGNIPSDYRMWQPRLAVTVDAFGDSSTVIRGTGGLYYSRVPGLVLASSRSTNGSIGQTLFRNSALTNVLGPVPAYTELIPQSETGDPFRPDVFVFDKDFRNPRTTAFSLSVERMLSSGLSTDITFNYAETDFLTRFANRNDVLLGSPWGMGLGTDGTNGINSLTVVESTARSKYWGVTLSLIHI